MLTVIFKVIELEIESSLKFIVVALIIEAFITAMPFIMQKVFIEFIRVVIMFATYSTIKT